MRLLAAKMSGGAKAYAAVVLIRIMYSGMHVMSKVALDQGMNPLVFLFYRHTTAALVLIPVTFVVERRKAKPVTFKIGWKMFIHALYGVTACGDLFNLGLNYTSATSSSALYNVQPVVTFILAVIFGMETLKLTRFHGKVKFAGILFCVAGVTILAFYEGPMFRSFNHHHLFQNGGGGGGSSAAGAGDTHSKKQWVLGIFLMTLSNVLAGLWTVLQGPLIEDTSKLMNTTLQISWASLQAFLVAVAVERDFSKWRLGWNVGLAAIIYSGVIVTALSYYMQMWTIAKRGPVFLAMSMPLTFVFTIVISSFVIGDAVSLGSIFAGALLVGGLYNVFWGKSIEERDDDDLMNKISGPGKAGLDKAADNNPASSSQVPDDGAEAKV
ncbi:WAT1-related protein At5g64700 [Zea mays]|uniref:WAT1-related protein n=1 Tax=Zea mays TaxID=4577 RepID=K7VUU6_MAIZE|nr:WAT1-related protein At5g64700 [Zea mays]ONM57912.1 Nodulin-like protein [Zea mays]